VRYRRDLLLKIGFSRRLIAEFVGTWGLVMVVVGSGIMGERLSDDVGVQLLANTLATAAGLVVLISLFAPVSGAHFNPLVSAVQAVKGRLSRTHVGPYVVAQVLGACAGAMTANAMFGLSVVDASSKAREGGPIIAGEVVATAVLVLVIEGFIRGGRAQSLPMMVAAWISAAYWCTSSTSFANPAVSIGRSMTESFAGISPESLPMFFVGQVTGAMAGLVVADLAFGDQE
jgi:glycerol uptake facilitator-like aquaporin